MHGEPFLPGKLRPLSYLQPASAGPQTQVLTCQMGVTLAKLLLVSEPQCHLYPRSSKLVGLMENDENDAHWDSYYYYSRKQIS